MSTWKNETEAREQIKALVADYYNDFKKPENDKSGFKPGDRISYASRVYDEKEMQSLTDAMLDFWLTSGRFSDEMESKLSKFLGVKYASLVNSGSSANLIAFSVLTSPELGKRRILAGDEVICVAAAFPTTVAPIFQCGAIPVFVDISIPEYNIDPTNLNAARSKKTKAVFIAHTLGNPFDVEAVKSFCDENGYWLIEDNCDALGSEYTIDGVTKKTGTWGHIGTSSFYPPHHMTMGEGGAVYTNDPLLNKITLSFRDWGRDCWCASGVDNTCHMRFTGQFGELPKGYDHKYVYSHFGFNLKITDMQAAVGCAQLDKLDQIVAARRANYQMLYDGLKDVPGLILPVAEVNSNPSWFGFLIAVKEDAGFTRNELTGYLEQNKIQTRNLFAGNLTKHPCFDEMRQTGEGYRIVGELKNTDFVMTNGFWIGVFPGMTKEMNQWMIKCIKEFCTQHAK